MKKRLMLALMLLLCAALLVSCGEKQRFDVLTNNNGGSTQQNMGQQKQPAQEENPLAEEDDYADLAVELPTQVPVTPTPAPTVRSQYAGATPVVLDPIDKPTPTAVPKLSVTYTAYDAIKLGLSFEGPVGWQIDETSPDTFVIWNPNARMDFMAQLTLTAQKVSSEYTTSDLKTVVKSMLDSIEDSGFDTFSPSNTDTRTLLGKNGVYANYSGTLAAGPQVSGRVHAVCVDKVLYTVHLVAPKSQWNDYKDMVYDKLRDTLTITK